MGEPDATGDLPAKDAEADHARARAPGDEHKLAARNAPANPATSLTEDPAELSPEEQLARYEESLKEDDWGHQPC